MKIIVCGAGQVGYQIVRYLSKEGNSVTVIDHNSTLVRQITDELDVSGVHGFASRPDILARAGARDADMLIAATSMDEVNMVACQVAHSVFDVTTKIARIRTDSYLGTEWSDLFRRDHMPIDVVISPENEVARVVLRRLASTACFDIKPFLNGMVDLGGIRIDKTCPVQNTSLRQLTELFSTLRAIVVGIRRDGKLFSAHADDQIFAGDDIYFITAHKDLNRIVEIFGRENKPAKRIVIVGAGNVGLKVAREIEKFPDIKARIIEIDRERAEYSANILERTIVLHGNALKAELLTESGVDMADAIVALTEDSRTNLLSCALAKEAGATISVAISSDPIFERLADSIGIDALINPRSTTVSSILRHVRRGRIKAVYSIGTGEAEVIEAQVMATSPIAGKYIRDIKFPTGSIVGAVLAEGNLIMPHGDTEIRVGNVLVVFAEQDAVHRVEQLFRVSMEFF